MQAPFVDVCGTTAVIADQQGMQVYVFDEEGLKGQFQTKLPIQKARVATQGVVAVILADDDVTWVNFYDASGTLIAENRTTIDDLVIRWIWHFLRTGSRWQCPICGSMETRSVHILRFITSEVQVRWS